MLSRIAVLAALLAMLCAAGCSGEPENGFKDSRPEVMLELKGALKAANIPFRVDDQGSIKYSNKYDSAFKQIKDRIEKDMSGGIAWKLDDAASREYLKNLLASMGKKYWVQPRDDGEWILWHPTSRAQEREVQMKVVEHAEKLGKK